ncbi:unnamed protein product [Rhizopus stolonifer]
MYSTSRSFFYQRVLLVTGAFASATTGTPAFGASVSFFHCLFPIENDFFMALKVGKKVGYMSCILSYNSLLFLPFFFGEIEHPFFHYFFPFFNNKLNFNNKKTYFNEQIIIMY